MMMMMMMMIRVSKMAGVTVQALHIVKCSSGKL